MDKTNTIILVLIGAVLFSVGGGLGIIYQSQKNYSEENIFKALSSEVVSSIVAYGEVTEINGRNITLIFNNDSFTIYISEKAKIYSFKQTDDQESSSKKELEFNQIKKGDILNVSMKIYSDGTIEGSNVFILPSLNIFP